MPASKIVLPLSALVVTSAAFAIATASGASAPNPTTRITTPSTPNDCIRRNGGDYNACNVGNQGRGDLPYRSIP